MFTEHDPDEPDFRWCFKEIWKDYEHDKIKNDYTKDTLVIDVSNIIYFTPFTSQQIKDYYFPDKLFLESWFSTISKSDFINIVCDFVLSASIGVEQLLHTINDHVYNWVVNGFIDNRFVPDVTFTLYNYTLNVHNDLIDVLERYGIKYLVNDSYNNYKINYDKFGKIIDISNSNKDIILCTVYVYRKKHEIRISRRF